MCQKVSYDKKGAQTALNNIKNRYKKFKQRKENRIYHCPFCNGWHLTSHDLEDKIEEVITISPEFKKYLNG